MYTKKLSSLALMASLAVLPFLGVALAKDQVKPPSEKPTAPAAQKPVEVPPQVIELVEGKLKLSIPGKWPAVKPRSRIIKHEFSIPAVEGDKVPGRMTIMSAGGSIDANIARWVGQFRTTEGKPLGEKDKKIEKKELGDLEVHLVDLTGEFQDQPRGPFGPKVARPDYRMLAAIIPVKKSGTWFIKLYGPKRTIGGVHKQFHTMISELGATQKKN